MSDGHNDPPGVLGEVAQHLESVFRHVLPGVLVIGAARVAHPSWFNSVRSNSWQDLAVLTVVAVAIGNTWFALNRYGPHQLVDYILYLIKSKGPARVAAFSYLDDLGRFTYRSLHTPDASARARRHVAFRASTVLLVLTIGELAVLFGFWHESDSVLGSYMWQVVVAGIIALVIGIWQMVITRRIDYYVVNPPKAA